MQRSISTLVPDIYKVLAGEIKPTEEQVKSFSERLAKNLADRLVRGADAPRLRPSNWAMVDKKLWYTVNKPELAEPMLPQVYNKFNYGAILEEYILWLAEVAGHDVQHKQQEVSIYGITGSIDGVIDGVVVDCKSATSRGFDKFKYHLLDSDDSFGYRAQLDLYVLACQDLPGVKVKAQGGFLAINKENGELALDLYTVRKIDYEAETRRKLSMLALPEPPKDCLPPIPDGKSGNMQLPLECRYCQFKKHCHPEVRTFIYSSGPRYLTKVVREPDVPEV